ncbi:MAG TPA: hypothetical protein PKM21_12945 [Anaerolineales bacterium]|nr:hypothetical protein [Anaerolineales bacterium]
MKHRLNLFVLLVIAALLLSACTINLKTIINADGSGQSISEFGFNPEDLSSLTSYGFTTVEEYCNESASDMPANTTIAVEQRGEETFCILSVPFASLEELKATYQDGEVTINRLEIVDEVLYYDVSLTPSEETAVTEAAINWILVVPGSIQSHNATSVEGNTLTWEMNSGTITNMQVQSNLKAPLLGGMDIGTYVGIALACLCCLVVIGLIAVVVFIVLRKQKAAV